MLSAIFDTLRMIGDFFSMLFSVVVDLLKGLADFVFSLGQIPSLIASLFGGNGMLPLSIVGGFTAVIATVIILRILGRD